MRDMSVDWFAVTIVVSFVVGAVIALRPSQVRRRQRGEKFAADNLAYIDSEFVEHFDRVGLLSTRVGVAVCGALVVPMLIYAGETAGPNVRLGNGITISACAAAFVVVAAVRLWLVGREFPVPVGRLVIARPRRVGVTDYVPPEALGLCAVCSALAVVGGYISLRVDAPVLAGGSFACAIVAAAAPLYLWLTCRRPESAVDAAHLYFQDAWRASLMQSVVRTVMIGTTFVFVWGPGFGSGDSRLENASTEVAFLVAGGILVLSLRGRLWFRKRLWPQLAPGQVLLPGQTVGVAE
jgi:hypothetical protein